MKRILVIDDEEWLREMVHLALAQKGYDVLEAENGAVGVELARKSLPDLVLCDVNMDKFDGYQTLASIRNEPTTTSIPFILMTGLADHAGMRHGMELGADDYLPKPFTIEALFAAVDTRLKKAQKVREEAEQKLADLRDNISLMLPHELRTPLNGILAYGEILSSDASTLSPAEVAEMGQVIHESGKRLERLIESFLFYAQLEVVGADPQKVSALRHQKTPAPLRLIEEHAHNQAQLANRTSDLILELEETPAPMSQEYLVRIIDELVQNAFKFSQTGTCVKVAYGTSFPSGVTLVVSDQGRGFSTEHIAKVGAYMQFDRKMQEQQGLGLGLSIAKRLTELHGGTLAIHSGGDSKTTVTVRLPSV
jgi:two-component system, sensor histidine kinase and response regulator